MIILLCIVLWVCVCALSIWPVKIELALDSRIYVSDFKQCQFNYSSGLPFVATIHPLATLHSRQLDISRTNHLLLIPFFVCSFFLFQFVISCGPNCRITYTISARFCFVLSIFSSVHFLSAWWKMCNFFSRNENKNPCRIRWKINIFSCHPILCWFSELNINLKLP